MNILSQLSETGNNYIFMISLRRNFIAFKMWAKTLFQSVETKVAGLKGANVYSTNLNHKLWNILYFKQKFPFMKKNHIYIFFQRDN